MEILATVQVPKLIYEIYALAAEELEGYTVEQVMSSALCAYARYLYDDMRANGEPPDSPSSD